MDAFFALSSSSTVGSSLSASSKSKERFGNDFSGILWVHFSGPIFQHAKILKDPKFRTSTQNLHKFIGGSSRPLGRAWSMASSSHRAAKMGWGALFKNGIVLKSLSPPPPLLRLETCVDIARFAFRKGKTTNWAISTLLSVTKMGGGTMGCTDLPEIATPEQKVRQMHFSHPRSAGWVRDAFSRPSCDLDPPIKKCRFCVE